MLSMGIGLKVLVDKEKKRVIFAECDHDFVDVLFSFLTMPIGAILRLGYIKSSIVGIGCMDNLYKSVENVKDYFQGGCKDMLLSPRNGVEAHCTNLKMNINNKDARLFFRCSVDCTTSKFKLLSSYSGVPCDCGSSMYNWISIKKTQRQNEVFVERANRYIVSDDLQVMLLCTATSFSLLSKCGIMDGNAIEERAFNLGKNEVLDLLMNSLVSRTPLTETLLKHKPVPIELNNVISYQRKSAKETMNQEQGIYVKLFVSKSKKMVCYAEAKKDFIDLLFSFLTVPLGHIVKQEYDYGSLKGCTDQLYKSVNDFGEQCFTSNDHKEMLVNPRVAPGFSYDNYLLGIEEASLPSCHYYSGDLISEPYFNELENKEESIPLTLKYSRSHDKEGESRDGFLKGMNLFTVTDNLTIKPVSPILGLSILNELKVPFNDIEERTVRVKKEEALNLLMSSFVSESALTNTFI